MNSTVSDVASWSKAKCALYLSTIAIVGSLALLLVVGANAEPIPNVCTDFRRLMDMPRDKGLGQYSLLASAIHGGEEQYFNLDVDGDDISDIVKGGCPASISPADACVLHIQLSSGKEIDFVFGDGDRFYLARYRSKVYAVVNHAGPGKNVGSRSVLLIDDRGVCQICSQL